MINFRNPWEGVQFYSALNKFGVTIGRGRSERQISLHDSLAEAVEARKQYMRDADVSAQPAPSIPNFNCSEAVYV